MCGPICAIGITGGFVFSRWLGIDEIVLGIWLGALLLSLSIQINKYFIKKNIIFPFSFWLVFIFLLLTTYLPLKNKFEFGWDVPNNFCGFPRIIFGAALGIIVFCLIDKINNWLIQKNNNKVYFYYQRVIVPISGLILASVIIQILC